MFYWINKGYSPVKLTCKTDKISGVITNDILHQVVSKVLMLTAIYIYIYIMLTAKYTYMWLLIFTYMWLYMCVCVYLCEAYGVKIVSADQAGWRQSGMGGDLNIINVSGKPLKRKGHYKNILNYSNLFANILKASVRLKTLVLRSERGIHSFILFSIHFIWVFMSLFSYL